MSKRRESRTGDNSALCVIFLQPALSVRVKTRRFSWRTRFNQGVFMASHDLSVFLEEFGATVNLTLPGIVSEKERLLLKLLMEGMSVTEISQYRNRSAKTISHQKKQLYEKLGIQSDITFWRDIFFNIIRKSSVAREIKIIFISLITIVTISSRLKPSVWRWKTTSSNRGSSGFLRADWGTDGL